MFQAVYYGADDGNRTHTTSLEGWSSTTKLHLQRKRIYYSCFAGVLSRAKAIKIKSKLENYKPARCAAAESAIIPQKKHSEDGEKFENLSPQLFKKHLTNPEKCL